MFLTSCCRRELPHQTIDSDMIAILDGDLNLAEQPVHSLTFCGAPFAIRAPAEIGDRWVREHRFHRLIPLRQPFRKVAPPVISRMLYLFSLFR